MNRPTTLTPGPLVLISLICMITLARLLPHPPNFSPVAAIALFGGAYFASHRLAFFIPLLAMLATDLLLGLLHGGIYTTYFMSINAWLVYGCVALFTLLGCRLRSTVSGWRVLGYSLTGSIIFFVVTNFGAFFINPIYPKTAAGLMSAYIAGIPFFQWTVLSTLLYSAVLFGSFATLRHNLPSLRAHTV